MTNQNTFELQTVSPTLRNAGGSATEKGLHPALQLEAQSDCATSVLQFAADVEQRDGPVWIGVDETTHIPCFVRSQEESVAAFHIVERRLGTSLCMTTQQNGVLVNGIPALDFTVLSPRDSVVIVPGVHSYVTDAYALYVGASTEDLLTEKCPFCRIRFTAETRLVTCRCGVAYHAESAESHGEIADEERLNCLSKLRACLSCGREVTLEEYLVWNPGTL